MTALEQEAPQQEESLVYYISFERLEQLKRSVVALLEARLPQPSASGQRSDQNPADLNALIAEVAEYGNQQEDFIRTEMPIQEIVFRLLLTRNNTPTDLHQIHYELTERWATPIRPINITESALAKILDADTYYGFAQATAEE